MAEVLDSMSTRAGEDGTYNQEDVEAILHILRVFGDDCHQAKEEGALFPVFGAVCDRSEYAAVRHMLFEHEQDRSLIEGTENAVYRSNPPNSLSMPNDLRPFSETTFTRTTTFYLRKSTEPSQTTMMHESFAISKVLIVSSRRPTRNDAPHPCARVEVLAQIGVTLRRPRLPVQDLLVARNLSPFN
jgi:hypothetical protein